MSLETELKTMIVSGLKITDVDPATIQDGDPLFGEGLGLDSLDAVELVLLLKKKYQVEIKDMDEANAAFASVGTLAGYIREHQAGS